MAMFTINGLICFLQVGVLQAMIPMREFPAKARTAIRLQATVFPSFSATGFIRLGKLWELDTLAVVFMLNVSLRVSIRVLTLRPIIRLRLHT